MIDKQKGREKEEKSKKAKNWESYQLFNFRSVAGLKISNWLSLFFSFSFLSFPLFFPLFFLIHTDSTHVNATQTVAIYYNEKCFDV
jgi:hypothetical protein